MSYKTLKIIRVVVGLIFFLAITALFVDFRDLVPERFMKSATFLQFVPSLLKFITIQGIAGIGFILVLILTVLFGRVYCSTICPLGIMQDIINYFSQKLKSKKAKRFHFKKPLNVIRYPVLIIVVLFYVAGSIFLINWLDPYSTYGRFTTYFFKPVIVGINNGISAVLKNYDIFFLYPVHPVPLRWGLYIFPALLFVVILYLTFTRGRLFCNTVCPVGVLLGFVSKFSIFKIGIKTSTCINCGKCEHVCKAECVDFKQHHVDMSRCVGCFNCLSVCPTDAAGYYLYSKPLKKNKPVEKSNKEHTGKFDPGKRKFIAGIASYLVGLSGLSFSAFATKVNKNDNLKVIHRKTPVSPPGSLSIERFTTACTACTLCVSACPTKVLQPSFLEYGFLSIMQPRMDYLSGYCNFDCTKCSEVCPTGAILPVDLEKKQTTQLGIAHFVKQNCVVYTESSDCGACSEHCPTKAVHMIPYKNGLVIPEVTENICVGCGACEFACPVDPPHKAIYVEGNPEHQAAQKPKQEKLEEVDDSEDFPF